MSALFSRITGRRGVLARKNGAVARKDGALMRRRGAVARKHGAVARKHSAFIRKHGALIRATLLSALAVGHITIGCAFTDLVFRLPRSQVRQQIYYGEHEFLREIDYNTHDINETARLHAGARYYLSEVYRSLNLHDTADAYAWSGWRHERGPWRYQSGLDILAALSEERNFLQAEPIAAQGVAEFDRNYRYLYYYLEALYWRRNYGRVLDLLDEFRAQLGFEQGYAHDKIRQNSGEAQLWEAVSRYRGGAGSHRAAFEKLFYDYSASDFHSRVYSYIIDEPPLVDEFTTREITFFKAKYFVAERTYARAAQAFEEALDDMSIVERQRALTPRTIRDLGRAYFYGGYGKSGQARLTELAEQLYGPQLAAILEWHGRLLLKAGRHNQAQETLLASYEQQPSDRILWLLFDSAFSRSFSNGLNAMKRHGHLMIDRRYYSDIFDRQVSLALRERRWDYVWELRDIAVRHGAPYDRARLAVIVAEGARVGATRPPPDVSRLQLRQELDIARQQTQSAHYAYIAAFMLGKSAERTFTSPYQYSGNSALSSVSCRRLIDGYWQFHLIRQGYRQLRECVHHYSTEELQQMARALYSRGIFNYAIRIMDIARSRRDFNVDGETMRILYPRAYAQYIDRIAERNGIPPYFFYSLIREESYFTPAINSHAGAVGLGQFIPSTARAVANRMNISYPDLTDPEQNLTLSGFHIRELVDELEDKPLFALAAYNAGPRRAQRWIRLYDDYSDLLKHESMDFRETRHYVRKIMVTNIQYAQLYQHTSINVVIKRFFTDLTRF